LSLSDYLLATLGVYGLPVLFGALLVGSAGVPLPASLLLVAAGSFVNQGELDLWPVLALSAAGAVLGDQLGYAVGRWGGRRLARRLGRLVGGEQKIVDAEEWLKRRGGVGVFLSRWLLTPLGPVVNLTAGASEYPWPRFLLFDVLGEALWVALYVLLGKLFSDRVQEMSDLLGDLTWAILGLAAAAVLGFILFKQLREPEAR
jgi:membrane protein DedA with SNARE-associated domain